MFSLGRKTAAPYIIVAICALALLLLATAHAVLAQTSDGSVSISVSPQSLDIAVNPGQSTANTFRITNGSNQSITVQPTPRNFVPYGNEGAIQIEESDTPYSLAQWLSVTPKGETTIQPNQTADFVVAIAVPENADPGGHFGSVVFRTLPSSQPGSAATVSQEVAPVILVRIPGDAREEASIVKFSTVHAPITTSNTPITFEAITKNSGTVHFKPTGTVSVFNTFGKQVATTSLESNNVIPGAERKMNAIWQDTGLRFGYYTARLTMVYGKDNSIITAQTSFAVIPMKQTLLTLAVLGVLTAGVYRMRHRLILAAKILAGREEGP